jgi:hypothetical protein
MQLLSMAKIMRNAFVLVSTICLLFAQPSQATTPAEFSWVNMESDKTTMTAVRRALHDRSITAIREVGVQDGFALVMTASRDGDAPTPASDRWTIYNVSLTTGKSRVLVSGYVVELLDWIGQKQNELAISYSHCYECEPVKLFTVFHFTKGVGWRARWSNSTKDANYPQPGAVVSYGDVGAPYTDDEVDQVFAIGSWFHSRNTKTGKIDDDVYRYSIDSTTGKDRLEKLSGNLALNWKRKICTDSSTVVGPSLGQHSKACRAVLKANPK